ncbi:MAG: type II secretion system F family protein [Nanoarchaeota archaeon]|nr:type II secretion system F family protein [Nanoarchaeota archaeon]
MLREINDPLLELKKQACKERKLAKEIASMLDNMNKTGEKEREMINHHLNLLVKGLKQANDSIPSILENIKIAQKLPVAKKIEPLQKVRMTKEIAEEIVKTPNIQYSPIKLDTYGNTLKRLKKKEKAVEEEKIKGPRWYLKTANNFFSNNSMALSKKKIFDALKKNLIKANISTLPTSYISIILLTTLLSFASSIFILAFFLFFDIGSELPIITRATTPVLERFGKCFWVVIGIPVLTFLALFFYPAIERKSIETKINQELPFVTIHMSAISGSMVEPSRIFSIIVSTKEYPYMGKEFTKLINKINIYGYDLVTALRDCSINTASKSLGELFNGMASTITSGGDLQGFFEKRANTLLFEYRIEREKYTRSAETFMDIYISVVIAAPMILMLLLMMMSISGLGLKLSPGMITLIMVLGVSAINVIFLTFLHLKKQ